MFLLVIVGCNEKSATTSTEVILTTDDITTIKAVAPTEEVTTTTAVATVIPSSLVGTYRQVVMDITADLGVVENNATLSGIEYTTFSDVTITLASDGTFSSTTRKSNSYEIPTSMAAFSSTFQDMEVETKEEGTVEVFDGYIGLTLTQITKTTKIGSNEPDVVTFDINNIKYLLYGETWIFFNDIRLYKSADQLFDLIPGDYFRGGIVGIESRINSATSGFTFDNYVEVSYEKLVVTSISDVDLYKMKYYLKTGATDGKKYLLDQETSRIVETASVEYELQMADILLESSTTGVYSFTADFGTGDMNVLCYQHSDSIAISMGGTSKYIRANAFEYESYIFAPLVNIGTLDPTQVVIYALNEEGTQVVSTSGSSSTILEASNGEEGLNVVYKVNNKFYIKSIDGSFIYGPSKSLSLSTDETISVPDGFFLGIYTIEITEYDRYTFYINEDWSKDETGVI